MGHYSALSFKAATIKSSKGLSVTASEFNQQLIPLVISHLVLNLRIFEVRTQKNGTDEVYDIQPKVLPHMEPVSYWELISTVHPLLKCLYMI